MPSNVENNNTQTSLIQQETQESQPQTVEQPSATPIQPTDNQSEGSQLPSDSNTPVTEGETKPSDDTALPTDDPQEPEQAPQIDYQAFEQEFKETGSLSEESFSALEKAGIPREYVERYLEAQPLVVEKAHNDRAEHLGVSRQEYNAVLQWVANNYSPEDIEALNKPQEEAELRLKLDGIYAKYRGANPPRFLQGSSVTSSSYQGSVYRSEAEVARDMADRRYRTDPAYRQSVEAKLARSKVF